MSQESHGGEGTRPPSSSPVEYGPEGKAADGMVEEIPPASPDLRALTDSLPMLVSQVDRDLRYRYVNRAYLEWFGHSLSDLRGKTLEAVLGSAAVERLRPHLEAVLSGRRVTFEDFLSYRAGPNRWVQADYVPHLGPDGRVHGFFALVRDISNRKRAEEAVLDREAEYRALFELAGSGNAQAEAATGRFLRVNRKFCEITGFSEAELLGMTFRDITHPDDRPADSKLVEPVLRGELDGWDTEKRYLRKDGATVWVHVVGRVMRGPDGKPRSTVATIVDITAQRRAEEEREQLLTRLREANEGLEEAAREKDRFLAMLAHELRNPLAVLAGAIQARDREAVSPEWFRRVIRRSVSSLERLVDDLLDLSRISSDRLHLQCESVDLGEAVREAAEDVLALFEEAGQVLEFGLPAGPIPVHADPVRLRQILLSLLVNAVHFSPDAGVTRVEVRQAGSWSEVEVADKGSGLEPEVMERLQELFAREAEGLGPSPDWPAVGLVLAHRLARLHGGALSAASPGPGLGSTFTLKIPVFTESAPPMAPEASDEPRLGIRVLVVDDNGDAAFALASLLELHGARVDTEADGPAALRAVEAGWPDAAVLDLGLPGMSGHDLAHEFRQRGFPGLLVALSGYGQPKDRSRSAETGFDHHLVKPVDLKLLLQILGGTSPAVDRT